MAGITAAIESAELGREVFLVVGRYAS